MSDLLKIAEQWEKLAIAYTKNAEAWLQQSTVEHLFTVQVTECVAMAKVYQVCARKLRAVVAKERRYHGRMGCRCEFPDCCNEREVSDE